MEYVTIEEIQAASRVLPPIVRRTPLWPFARDPSEIGQERLFLKLENLQAIGAYKVRAAFTMIAALSAEQRARGIVFTSSGNFAQAFALAGKHFGVRTRVVMLASTSPYKIEAARALGAEVELFDGPALRRQSRVEALGRELEMTVIDTWEERPIIAGHGTLGLEMLQDLSDVEQILVPVSSGGMAAGVAAGVKQVDSRVRVIGVRPPGLMQRTFRWPRDGQSRSLHGTPLPMDSRRDVPANIPSPTCNIFSMGSSWLKSATSLWPI